MAGLGLGLGLGLQPPLCAVVLANYDFTQGAPGFSCTRASDGYALNSAGLWVPFGPNTLRRTDRGLTVEPARTNLCVRSAEINNSVWTKSRATVAVDVQADPLGTTTADKIIEDNTNGMHYVYKLTGSAAGQRVTGSIHLRAAEKVYARVSIARVGAPYEAVGTYISLLDGLTSEVFVSNGASQGAAASLALGGGWYRVSMTGVIGDAASVGLLCHLTDAPGSTNLTYTGDGASSLCMWGAQLEAGAQATSYIPTTTAAVARAADAVTCTLPSGTSRVTYVFDDGSVQTVAASPGPYTIPTNLARGVIARMQVLA